MGVNFLLLFLFCFDVVTRMETEEVVVKMSVGEVLFEEQYGSSSIERSYVCTESGKIKAVDSKKEKFQSVGHVFAVSFLTSFDLV